MSKKPVPPPPEAQIYLVTPLITDADAFAPVLAETVARTSAACVLLRLDATEERALINAIKILAPVAQDLGAAVLVENNHRVATRGGADGVHVTEGAETLAEAIAALKPDRIVGVGLLPTKHEAMEAAEQDVDYVMFSESAHEAGAETDPARAERAQWWAEVFEMPCVACAANVEEAATLRQTGAEFVALGPWAFPPAKG
ncbi:MAG: thiamine phosphate synthase [Beijerinckiaceae bacterium]